MVDNENNENFYDLIQSPGEMLRQARLAKEFSIAEISRETRISKAMVEALENGEHKNLPGRTYETGYIRLICRMTGDNPDPIIKKWVEEYYSSRDLDPYVFPESMVQKESSYITFIGIIIAVVIVIAYSSWYYYSMRSTPIIIGDYSTSTEDISKIDTSELKNTDMINKTIKEEEEYTIDNSSELFDVSLNDNQVLQKNLEGVSSVINKANENENLLGQPNNVSLINNEIDDEKLIILHGLNDSWIQIVHENGDIFYTGMLKREESMPLPLDGDLTLSLGNAGAVGINVNNSEVKSLGNVGEIIQSKKVKVILQKIQLFQ